DHDKYVVAYKATFAPPRGPGVEADAEAQAALEKPASPVAAAKAEPTTTAATEPAPTRPAPVLEPAVALSRPAAGEANIEWEVGLVRDVPKTGRVVGRLQRGTKVKLGPTKDGWY